MDAFVARQVPRKLATLAFWSFAFVGCGLWMVGAFGEVPESRRYPSVIVAAAGWFGLLFFGLCGLAFIRDIFGPRAQLRIDRNGVRWQPFSIETIPWSDILEVKQWRVKNEGGIELMLKSDARYRKPGFLDHIPMVRRKFGAGNVSIHLSGYDRSFEEAMAAINRFRPT